MDTKTTLRSVLVALLELARANLPASVDRIAGRLGISHDEVRDALDRLDDDGLADAMRARLTLRGLAVASRLAERREVRLWLAA
jgi:Mn-dependent DtxR family transcriptional regulator